MSDGNCILAGMLYYADIKTRDDKTELSEVEYGVIIEFESAEDCRKAIADGKCNFTMFGVETA